MNNYTLHRRSFKALDYPPGPERDGLNESALTSAYMPSYKWIVLSEEDVKHGFSGRDFRTKQEAELYILLKNNPF